MRVASESIEQSIEYSSDRSVMNKIRRASSLTLLIRRSDQCDGVVFLEVARYTDQPSNHPSHANQKKEYLTSDLNVRHER